MQASDVIARIQAAIPQAQVQVEGADCSFSVVVISDHFAGLLPVKRQQQVLACFSDLLASGDLHALTVNACTAPEWQQKNSLTQLSL
jgi:acid stress-induced BolA-like protein IbaG/YrbA